MKNLPQKLNKGDTIGIISPAGSVRDASQFDLCEKFFEKRGYKVKISPNALNQNRYLAGSDAERLDDLMSFFQDDEIKAILCSRGGYGTYRLLDKINFDIIRQNPKIFAGYSDITALLNNFYDKSLLVSFHAPLALSDFGVSAVESYTENNFFEILEGKAKIPYKFQKSPNYRCISEGETEAELMGGNLTVLCGLLGTPYFPSLEEKLLLLEDIGEPLYKIDRMLTQLKLAGVFEKVKGVLFGDFSKTDEGEKSYKLTVDEIINDILGEYKIPVGYGFSASHEEVKSTLPLGVKYRFNSEDFALEIIENYLKNF